MQTSLEHTRWVCHPCPAAAGPAGYRAVLTLLDQYRSRRGLLRSTIELVRDGDDASALFDFAGNSSYWLRHLGTRS